MSVDGASTDVRGLLTIAVYSRSRLRWQPSARRMVGQTAALRRNCGGGETVFFVSIRLKLILRPWVVSVHVPLFS